MKFRFMAAAAFTAFMALPAIAQAATGFATANVNMRSGPSTSYPAVVVIPAGSQLEIHGCLANESWCDVTFVRGRGWVSGRYIQVVQGRDRVYVDRPYYRQLGIPIITFSFDSYWDRNYRGRDFYRDRDRWRNPAAQRPPQQVRPPQRPPQQVRPPQRPPQQAQPPRPPQQSQPQRPPQRPPQQAQPPRPPQQAQPPRPPQQAQPPRPPQQQVRPQRPPQEQGRPGPGRDRQPNNQQRCIPGPGVNC